MSGRPYLVLPMILLGWTGCGGGEVSTRVLCSLAATQGQEQVFARWSRRMRAPTGLARWPDGGQPTVLDEHMELVHAPPSGPTRVVSKLQGTPREPLDVSVSWVGDLVVYRVHNARPSDEAANPLVALSLADGSSTQLSVPGRRARLSPDGTRLATIVDGAVHVAALDGSAAHTHALAQGLRAVHPVWTPQGQLHVHAMGQQGSRVVRLDPATGATAPTPAPYQKDFGLKRVPEQRCVPEPARR